MFDTRLVIDYRSINDFVKENQSFKSGSKYMLGETKIFNGLGLSFLIMIEAISYHSKI